MRTIALQLLIAVLLCATCGCLAASTDYYKTLNVRKDASLAQIKSAYRKLSKKYHPDRNKAQEAEEKFLQISKAYEILSEEELRTIYDQHVRSSALSVFVAWSHMYHREKKGSSDIKQVTPLAETQWISSLSSLAVEGSNSKNAKRLTWSQKSS